MRDIDTTKAYALLDVIGEFLGDIRSTLQDTDAADSDSVADVRRDVWIRIGNCAAKLNELADAVGCPPPWESHGDA